MSILKFAGFDIFPGQAAAGNTLPVQGAGFTGTPYATLFPPVVSNTNHRVGVSGLPAHKMGSGAKLRNAVVCYRPAGTSTYALFPLINGETLGNGAWSRVINFTVKDISTADVNVPMSILTLGTGVNVLNAFLFGLTSSRNLLFNGSTVNTTKWDLNREYSIEVKLWRVGTEPNDLFNLEVRIDGVVLRTAMGISAVAFGSPLYITLGINSNTNLNSARTLLFSDIVVSDGDYIGPSLVLQAPVTAVASAGGWEKDGNADPATTLSDGDDSTYYFSPTDNGSLNLKLGLAEDPGVPVRGAQFFVRSSRDVAAGRAMQVTLENAGGTVSAGPISISNTTSFADYQAFAVNTLAKLGDLSASTLKIRAVVP